jgi:hypothetical protein
LVSTLTRLSVGPTTCSATHCLFFSRLVWVLSACSLLFRGLWCVGLVSWLGFSCFCLGCEPAAPGECLGCAFGGYGAALLLPVPLAGVFCCCLVQSLVLLSCCLFSYLYIQILIFQTKLQQLSVFFKLIT